MKFIVAGCGHQGAELALNLTQSRHEVTVIDVEAHNFEQLGSNFKGMLLQGVAFDQDILLKAGIDKVDGLAAVTSSDDANIVTALLARNIFHVPHVVARVNDPRQAEIYRRLGLQTTTPTRLAVNQLVQILTQSEFNPVLSFGSGEVQLLQVEAPMPLLGRSINSITVLGEISVVAITRRNQAFLPTLGTVIEPGDILHIASMSSSRQRLSSLLESS